VTDVSKSSAIVVIAVMLAIVVYYHWWRSVLVVIPPLLVALVAAFAVASLPPFSVRTINSNTAFLASIIVGNGINFALILLSRYVEERRRGFDVRTSLELAVAGSRAGTLAAAAAASVSYAALAITQFQGFRQFGYIGGLGMIFAWGAAFLLMPSLIARVDRSDETRPAPVADHRRISFWIARAVRSAPRAILLGSVALTVVAAVEVSRYRASDIETDFSRLRRKDTWTKGEGYWGGRMNDVIGQYLTPLAFLTDDVEQARALGAALHHAVDTTKLSESIEEVRTIDDVLPTEQAQKITEIRALRGDLSPSVRASLDPEATHYVERLLAGGRHPVTLEQLPPSFTLGLRERDGTVGRIVLVFPKLSKQWWKADEMAQFVGTLRQIASDSVPDHPPRLAGAIPLSSDITQAVRHDGPIACFAALAGVVVMVLFLLHGTVASAYVIGALVVGVLWMAGTSHLIGVKINFTNFIAFPITFGIGVDYAANVISRYQKDGSKDILAAVRSTGAAVALCSLTTIIGYSSLLMAENRALFLFGLLAVLGEASCLSVALVSLPSFVIWRRAHSRSTRQTPRMASGTHAPGGSR
jgi:predicted RND superfamily exporter protein